MHRISVLQVQRTFGFATHARQTCAIAGWYSVADLNVDHNDNDIMLVENFR